MSEFEQQQDRLRYKNRAEAVETSTEAKEKQTEEAEKKMAARERLEQASREIKTTKNQMQNIVANMQQVVKAVQAIRIQLGLAPANASIPSVAQDERALQQLRQKLAGLYGEIKDLEQALLVEMRKDIQEEHGEWSVEAVQLEAERRVREILEKLGVSKHDL